MLGDFSVPTYDWINGTPLSDTYYYNKIKGNSITEHTNSGPNNAFLDLVFTNISN